MPFFRGMLVASMLVSLPLAIKHGTGIYHFLPFVPSVVYAGRLVKWQMIRPAAMMATCMTLAAASLSAWVPSVTTLPGREIVEELRSLERTQTGRVAMGYSARYRLSFFRPVLVFEGNPYVARQRIGDGLALERQSVSGRRDRRATRLRDPDLDPARPARRPFNSPTRTPQVATSFRRSSGGRSRRTTCATQAASGSTSGAVSGSWRTSDFYSDPTSNFLLQTSHVRLQTFIVSSSVSRSLA